VRVGEARVRIHAPLEHRPWHVHRTGDDAVAHPARRAKRRSTKHRAGGSRASASALPERQCRCGLRPALGHPAPRLPRPEPELDGDGDSEAVAHIDAPPQQLSSKARDRLCCISSLWGPRACGTRTFRRRARAKLIGALNPQREIRSSSTVASFRDPALLRQAVRTRQIVGESEDGRARRDGSGGCRAHVGDRIEKQAQPSRSLRHVPHGEGTLPPGLRTRTASDTARSGRRDGGARTLR
jgi:hypothetical protein